MIFCLIFQFVQLCEIIIGTSVRVYKYIASLQSLFVAMSWNDLFHNDIDMRAPSGAGSTGSKGSYQKTGYYHLGGRSQEADEQPRRSDTFRVWNFWCIDDESGETICIRKMLVLIIAVRYKYC